MNCFRILLLLSVPFCSVLCAATPDLVLRGEITGQENQTYRLVPFEVPDGIARITIQFAYSGREQRTTIDLGLVGPDGFRGQDGFRGWSGGNKAVFTVSAVDATPSYLPGPIRPGRWSLLLGIPNIRPQVRSEFTAEVYFSRSLAVADEPELLRRPLETGARWYRGDFHMHTGNSDGWTTSQSGKRVPAPVFVLAQTAAERHLDFVAVTDHNTISQAQAIRELQPYFDRLLLVPGRELTTFQGHANIFGTFAPLDFRVSDPAVPDWNTLLREAAKAGAFISINHPIRPSGEICLGCGWTPSGDLDYGRVGAIEVVNGRDADTEFSGIPFWHDLLNRGYRLTAIGGSDLHGWRQPPPKDPISPANVGNPTTVVYARELSTVALLDALAAGRVFVDVEGTTNRVLDFSAQTSGATATMGQDLSAPAGATVRFAVSAKRVSGGAVEVIVDGEIVPLIQDPHLATDDATLGFDWKIPDGVAHWIRVDVRNYERKLLLVGNPIYVNPNRRPAPKKAP